MKINEYIENEEAELKELKQRINEIKSKWIRFGLREEQTFLENYIKLKEEMINKLKTRRGIQEQALMYFKNKEGN